MSLIFIIMTIVAAGGVTGTIFQMRKQSKEHKRNREALLEFERKHPRNL